MIVTVYDQPKDTTVYTVSVQKNELKPLNAYLFLCIFCSYQIGQVQGLIGKIMPGLEPTDKVVVLFKCARCAVRYTFQDVTYKNPQTTRIVLTRWFNSVLRCYICMTPIIVDIGGTLIEINKNKPIVTPQTVKCSNYQCPATYRLMDSI